MQSRKKTILVLALLMFACMIAMPVQASAAAKLNKKSAILYTGATLKLKVTGTTQKVKWLSSKPSVATVSQSGKVKALKKGSAVISAKVGRKTYKCKLTVKQRVTNVTISKTTYFMIPGKSWTVPVSVKPSNANNKSLKWSSSKPSVAKVDSKGKVTAIANGTATITATALDGSKKKAVCKIIVLKPSSSNTGKDNNSSTGASASASRFLKILEKYSNQIKSDKAKGITWAYRNSGASKTWSDAVKRGKKDGITYSNCALMVNWAFREMGIIDKRSFWGEAGGEIHYTSNSKGSVKNMILKKCNIIAVYKTPQQLLDEGFLKPGDICTYVDYRHTNVYAGNGQWYDSGRSSAVGGYQDGTFVFSSFGPASTIDMQGATVSYIIRLK